MVVNRRSLGAFLRDNPFENGWTDGLFYREKMRAIHRVAPASLPENATILEVGGGRSRMARRLFGEAQVTTIDNDPAVLKDHPPDPLTTLVQGDACQLPYPDRTFDVVTLFDVLEHIPDDRRAAAEASRVTKPGGFVLISTPQWDWHYPVYRALRSQCPSEHELMGEWGHVRRGYRSEELAELFGGPPLKSASFINTVTAFYHDVAFSRLRRRFRLPLYVAAAVPTAAAYALHRPWMKGTEIACAWVR